MDRVRKLCLYACAGVPEYWVLDLQRRSLFVYRKPEGDSYSEVIEILETGSIAAPGLAASLIPIATLLPKVETQET